MPTFWKNELKALPRVDKTPKVYKPIPKVGKRKEARLNEFGRESEVFLEVWKERKHECEECGKILRDPKAHNFDHIKPKGMNKALRYDPGNIRLLCFACHFKKTSGLNYKGPDLD